MLRVGDRITDGGYKGTVVGISTDNRYMISYDHRQDVIQVSSIYLTKIKSKLTYWK